MASTPLNSTAGFSTGNARTVVIDSNSNVLGNHVSANSANLGNLANVKITGGSNNQTITTDGYGNLTWVSFTSENANYANYSGNTNIANYSNTTFSITGSNVVGAVANANYSAYAGNVTVAAQSNITSLGTLTGLTVNGVSNLSAIANVKISGGASGQSLTTDGAGNLSWSTIGYGTSEYLYASIVGNPTISANTDIVASTVLSYSGSLGSTYNTSTGVFTLKSGVTYRLSSSLGTIDWSDTSYGYMEMSWVNANTNAVLANTNSLMLLPYTNGYNQTQDNTIIAYYTPTSDMAVKFRVMGGTGTVKIRDVNSGILVEQVGSTSLSGNVNIGGGGTSNISGSLGISANLTVVGKSNLGAVGNVTITGGSNGQVLTTDGSGNLSWANGGSGGNSANANYANFAGEAYSVSSSNVVGLGNVATINIDGNVNNFLRGNGTFGTIPTGALNYSQTLANSAVTITSAPANVVTVTITTNGNPVQIVTYGDGYNPSGALYCQLQLYRDGTPLGRRAWIEASDANENQVFSLSVIDTPSAGTHTYALTVTDKGAMDLTFGETDGPVIYAVELQNVKGDVGPASNSFVTITANGANITANSANSELTINPGNNITITGNVSNNTAIIGVSDSPSFANITVTGESNLGNVANITITGGSNGQALITDGAGNLVWGNVSGSTNIASGFVNAGVDVTLGNLKARIPTSGNRSLQLSTVSGTYSLTGSGYYVLSTGMGSSSISTVSPLSVTTTPAYIVAGYDFTNDGELNVWNLMDNSAGIAWRITMIIGSYYNNNMISIERIL